MEPALEAHRLHFAFTITFTIVSAADDGVGAVDVYLKTASAAHWRRALQPVGAILGADFRINFALGVVTGIPMEFQFGTNWAEFSKRREGVIGQTLAMEGVFSFFWNQVS